MNRATIHIPRWHQGLTFMLCLALSACGSSMDELAQTELSFTPTSLENIPANALHTVDPLTAPKPTFGELIASVHGIPRITSTHTFEASVEIILPSDVNSAHFKVHFELYDLGPGIDSSGVLAFQSTQTTIKSSGTLVLKAPIPNFPTLTANLLTVATMVDENGIVVATTRESTMKILYTPEDSHISERLEGP